MSNLNKAIRVGDGTIIVRGIGWWRMRSTGTEPTSAVIPGEILALSFAYHVAPIYVITLPTSRPRRGTESESPQREPGRVENSVDQQPLIPCLRVGAS
jgi:hypothetical protein